MGHYCFGTDAADWTSDLIGAANGAGFLASTLAFAARQGYLEAPGGSQLVAAAAIVAAALGGNPPEIPAELRDWILGKEEPLKFMAAAAKAGIARVRDDESELWELWQDSDDFSVVLSGIGVFRPERCPSTRLAAMLAIREDVIVLGSRDHVWWCLSDVAIQLGRGRAAAWE